MSDKKPSWVECEHCGWKSDFQARDKKRNVDIHRCLNCMGWTFVPSKEEK